MAKLTITDAARVASVSRVTLHRYIKAEKLSRSTDGTIDTAELLRIGLVLQSDTVLHSISLQRNATPTETSSVPSPNPATLQQLITVFQRELNAAHAREEAAREREALLLQMLQQVQQQNQRRTQSPPAPHRGHQEPGVDPRGAMRRRIVAMLHDHPEGLTPAEMRDLLGVDRSLADTCLGMLRYGLVQRVGRGRYVAAAPSRNER